MNRTSHILSAVTILLLLCSFCHCYSQIHQGKNDSLKQLIEKTNDVDTKTKALIELAGSLTTKDFDAAIGYADQGLLLATAERDSLSIAKFKRIAGQAHYFKGSYDKAASHFFEAIRILELRNEYQELAYTFNDLAKLYRKTRELAKAKLYYDQALDLFRKINDTSGVQMIWNESGVVFEYEGDYQEALRRYHKSLDIATSRSDSAGIGYALNFIAGVYIIEKNFDKAEQYLKACLSIRERLQDSFALALTYSDLGMMYQARKSYAEGMSSYMRSNAIAQHMGYAELQAANYKEMAAIAQATGNYQQALLYLQQAQTIRDSIYTVEKSRQITELSTKYETEKKEQQLQLQQLALSRKNYIITGVCLLTLFGGLLAYSYYRRYKLRQETRLQEEIIHQQNIATKAVLEAEEKERQRIAQDLHDGVGQMMSAVKLNLSAFQSELDIREEQLQHKLDNIFTLVDDSCREVRTVSHNMMPNALLKSGLSSAIREFLNKIDSSVLEVNLYTEGLDKHIATDMEIMLYRIIQECVNNVVKHSGASRLDISIIKDTDVVSATIEDNGKGFDTTDINTLNGIGLRNIASRVEYLKGHVEFDSRPGKGTVITINIPLSGK